MKKIFCVTILLSLTGIVLSQKDSTRKWRFCGAQASMNLMGPTVYQSWSLEKYQTTFKNDPFIHDDFSSYEKQNQNQSNISVGLGLRAMAEYITPSGKKREITLGIQLSGDAGTNLYYYKEERTIQDKYVSAENKDTVFRIQKKSSNYGFSIYSSKFYIPVGYHITSNKNKYLWASAGIEIAPGFSRQNYTSYRVEGVIEGLVSYTTSIGDYHRHYDQDTYKGTEEYHTERLRGIGFVGFASLPFTANLRFSKTKRSLKYIHLFAGVAPLFLFSSDRYLGTTSGLGYNMSLGLRFAR